jgi:hypothetical protein
MIAPEASIFRSPVDREEVRAAAEQLTAMVSAARVEAERLCTQASFLCASAYETKLDSDDVLFRVRSRRRRTASIPS